VLISDLVDTSPARLFSPTPTVSVCGTSQQQGTSAGRQPSVSDTQKTSTACPQKKSDPRTDEHVVTRHPQANDSVFLFGGTLSPADLVYLDEILDAHGLDGSIMAGVDHQPGDQSESIEAGTRHDSLVESVDSSVDSLDYECKLRLAAAVAEQLGLKCHRLAMPIGMARTDEFFQTLTRFGSSPTRPRFKRERERLVMRLADTDLFLSHRRVVVYGQEIDFVVGIVSLLLEAGMRPVLCASRGDADQLRRSLELTTPELPARTPFIQALQFSDLLDQIPAVRPDLLIANRDACRVAQRLGIPMVCAGRPLCSHSGEEDVLQIGYRGALQLLDRLQRALQMSLN
jgi:nitrogenase molybdenum-iron protein NifN